MKVDLPDEIYAALKKCAAADYMPIKTAAAHAVREYVKARNVTPKVPLQEMVDDPWE